MAERCNQSDAIAGRAIGWLDPDEEARLDAHIAECPPCAEELAAFALTVGSARLVGPLEPLPQGLEARTFLAVERAALEDGAAEEAAPVAAGRSWRLPRPSWPRRLALAGAAFAAVAALAVGVLVGRALVNDGPEGVRELVASLQAPGGSTEQGSADVRLTGIGRVVNLRTSALPILPRGQFYEVWFVGPGDRPGSPNRISAGTFHPDEDGRSHVTLAAAVDPALFPVLSITREAGDGDPRPGTEVLRSAA